MATIDHFPAEEPVSRSEVFVDEVLEKDLTVSVLPWVKVTVVDDVNDSEPVPPDVYLHEKVYLANLAVLASDADP